MEENVNPEPNKNKSNKGIFIVVAIMTIIIVALVGYIIVKNSDDSKKSGGEENKVSTSKVSNEIDEDKDDDEDDKKEKNTSKKNTSKNSSKNNTNTSNKNNTSKNSVFGKKDKNKTNTNSNTNTNTDTNTSTPNKTTAEISGDWKSGEFTIDGASYKLNCNYKDYTANGWSVDLSKAGYDDGYILNKNDKTYSTVDLENSKFDDANVNVGFINLGDSAKDISECQIWAISIDNKYSDTPVEFTLPGGIKNGSTLAEVEAAYGKPEADDIYRSDDLGYTTYTYDNDLKPQLRLTIYDNEGVTQFDYKTY